MHRWARASEHKVRTPPGWSYDRDLLVHAQAQGVERLVLHEVESGRDYHATLAAFWKHGFPRFAGQLELCDPYWRTGGEPPEEPPAWRQLSFVEP